MGLSGNTRELSLADLILVKANDPGTYRMRLAGPAGDGLLIMRGGKVVHASYGELGAADAAYLLVTEEAVEFNVESDVDVSAQTLNLSAQELLLEAMRRFDEGILKRPKSISLTMGSGVSTSARREPPRPRSHDARRSPEAEALRRATGRVLFAEPESALARAKRRSALLLAVPLGALAVVALVFLGRGMGVFTAREYRSPVKVSDLEGPRDALPILMSGGPAIAPSEPDADSAEAKLPSLTYRITIDRDGRVHPDPTRRQGGLDALEAAAEEALRSYRFSPALREGRPVPVILNWPVDFVRRALPSPTPVPVDERAFTDPIDEKPKLLEGVKPETPVPEKRLRPKIACRILVDEQGKVVEASVVSPRPDLELYEKAALDAVRSYTFSPGIRERVPVPTWITRDIEFR
jgi:periplasmic protein TonB